MPILEKTHTSMSMKHELPKHQIMVITMQIEEWTEKPGMAVLLLLYLKSY